MTNQNKRAIPGCKAMSKDGFWSLISEVKAAQGQEDYIDILITRLKELGPDHAQDFYDIVQVYQDLANKFGLWSAASLIGYISEDGFTNFRAWLISQGKEVYFAALKDPNALADLDPGDGYWFELFTDAGDTALEELADYFPQWYERHLSEEVSYVGRWNYKNPAVAEARQAGPPPKPQNNMEMGGM
nr:DUF4240 domain-containing protein [uncultured Oscillibacter sp.]